MAREPSWVVRHIDWILVVVIVVVAVAAALGVAAGALALLRVLGVIDSFEPTPGLGQPKLYACAAVVLVTGTVIWFVARRRDPHPARGTWSDGYAMSTGQALRLAIVATAVAGPVGFLLLPPHDLPVVVTALDGRSGERLWTSTVPAHDVEQMQLFGDDDLAFLGGRTEAPCDRQGVRRVFDRRDGSPGGAVSSPDLEEWLREPDPVGNPGSPPRGLLYGGRESAGAVRPWSPRPGDDAMGYSVDPVTGVVARAPQGANAAVAPLWRVRLPELAGGDGTGHALFTDDVLYIAINGEARQRLRCD